MVIVKLRDTSFFFFHLLSRSILGIIFYQQKSIQISSFKLLVEKSFQLMNESFIIVNNILLEIHSSEV